MAWLLNQNTNSLKYLPKIRPEPACLDYPTILQFREKHGFTPNGIHSAGHPIDDRYWPKKGQFLDQIESAPRLLGMCSFLLIPENWREIIEVFEPGLHQFKHIPLTLPNGEQFNERFYAINIRTELRNTVDMNLSTAMHKDFGDGIKRFINARSAPNASVVFKAKAIESYSLWQPAEILAFPMAVSNSLFEKLSSLGEMSTIKSMKVEEV